MNKWVLDTLQMTCKGILSYVWFIFFHSITAIHIFFLLNDITNQKFQDLLGVSLILPLILPMIKNLVESHLAAGCITSLYGGIQLFSSPAVVILVFYCVCHSHMSFLIWKGVCSYFHFFFSSWWRGDYCM